MSVAEDFIAYVLDLDEYNEDDDRAMSVDFLHKFVPAIIGAKDFTVALSDIAGWFGQDVRNLVPVLKKNTREGRDYKKVKMEKDDKSQPGPAKTEYFLTKDCIKRLVATADTPIAKQALTYLIALEDMQTEYALNKIQDRVLKELPEKTAARRRQWRPVGASRPSYAQFPIGHCVYVIECQRLKTSDDPTPIVCHRIGRTKNLNRRASEHWHLLYGFVKVVYFKLCPNHALLEIGVQTGLGTLKIENEVFIADPDEVIRTIEFVAKQREDLCAFTGKCAQTDEEDEANCFFAGVEKSPNSPKIRKNSLLKLLD